MNRLCSACIALLAAPMLPFAIAQQPAKVAKIGVITLSIPQQSSTFEAFRVAMRELGYAEGNNLTIIYRFAQGQPDKLRDMAGDLVKANVDVIVTESAVAGHEAKLATQTIPIVTAVHGDPVGAGLAKSLSRPGGNVTGLSLLAPELTAKRLQLLKELSPILSKVGLISNPGNPVSSRYIAEARTAARSLGLELVVVEIGKPSDLEAAFDTLSGARVQALVSLPDGLLLANHRRVIDFATTHGLPGVYPDEDFAVAGGLMVYGPSLAAQFRGAATYVDKILKGAKPGELPIEQPTRFEFIINLRAAQALRLAVPPSLLQRADRLIE